MLAGQQVIEAIKTRLIGNTDAAARVYSDRLWPLDEEKLPAWRIFPASEEITPVTVHWPPLREHKLTAIAQANTKAVSGIDAKLQDLRAQACGALFDTQSHATLGLPGVLMLEAGAHIDPADRNDLQLAQLALRLEITFKTFADSPDAFA